MRYQKPLFLISLLMGMLLSCADYNDLEESLHPTGVSLSIAGVIDTAVTLSWTRYEGKTFKNYKVYFNRGNMSDTTDSLADTLAFQGDTIATVGNLTPGNRYGFRVIVTTTQGGVGVSNSVDTTTILSMKGKLTLYPPDSTAITDSSVLLRWSNCVSNFDRYAIYMDTARAAVQSSQTVDQRDTCVKITYSDTLATIKGLSQGRTYSFRVFAWMDTGIIAKSQVMEVQINDNSSAWPQTLTVVRMADSTAKLLWRSYTRNDFLNYLVGYSRNLTVELTDTIVQTLTVRTDTATIVRGITPGTMYTFRVMVTTLGGRIMYGDNVTDTTTISLK